MGTSTGKRLVFIALIVTAAFVQLRALTLGFNSFWDLIHVFRNPFQADLSFQLIERSFSRIVEAEYTPFRLLTNSLDYTFWRLNPFGHHLASYLAFILNTGLVFLTLELILSRGGCSPRRRIALAGGTAFLFAIHPLKVEVVAWVTPREYILYSCFYLLTVIAYLKWVRFRKVGWYSGGVLFALAAGLSQPMSVTLPLVLLLLDFYPLRRWRKANWRRILAEKIPFFVIAFLTAGKIIQIRRAVQIIHPPSISSLLINAREFPAVILIYLYRTLFPHFLAPIYPIKLTANWNLILVAWLFWCSLFIFAVLKRRRYPALLVGLIFYLIMILPQGGLIRSGATVLADRYVYLASLPLLLGIAWYVTMIRNYRANRRPAVLLAVAGAACLIWQTISYTGLWDDPELLTRQAYDHYPRAPVIELFMLRVYNNAALAAAEKGDYPAALEQVKKALRIKPDYVDSFLIWSYILERQGRPREAIRIYRQARELKENCGSSHINLGVLFGNQGDLERAEEEFRKAVALGGDCAEARYNLGLIHKRRGEWVAAAREFRRALAFKPEAPKVHRQLEEVAARARRIP